MPQSNWHHTIIRVLTYNSPLIKMNYIINYFAFQPPMCTYDPSTIHLSMVPRKIISSIETKQYMVPYLYYLLDTDKDTLIICHGNAEDIGTADVRRIACMYNVNVCIFEYSGYGMHTCLTANEENIYEDVRAIYHHLIRDKGIDSNKIIIFGRSIGSGPACYLAKYLCDINRAPKGLILVSPILSALTTVIGISFWVDIFCNYEKAPDVKCPTLVIHGNTDSVVKYDHGQRLAELFPNLYNFVTIEGCGHDDIICYSYHQGIIDFLK